jgi:hypothetical protein
VLTGEIYGWQLMPSAPFTVRALSPANAGVDTAAGTGIAMEHRPLLGVETFASAGHAAYSINDPSMISLEDGSYRLYVGALVNIDSYPEYPELAECASGFSGGNYSWVILSATSLP